MSCGYRVPVVDLADFSKVFCSSCGLVSRLVVQTGLCEHLYCEKCLQAEVLRYGLYSGLVESDTMQNLCKCYVTELCKTYVNKSYIALTRFYVVSMPGLFFFCIKNAMFSLVKPGLLIIRGRKTQISRDFQGQIRGKIGRFRGNFAGIFGANFTKKQLVKNG